ncbi:uncharacterized protein UV8b_07810 [Ustilaginoidea virens]|uniref:Uncharacterized protein n=1 Tax=Ustilaginoidea virens TaxID=1159556 RepID=A0A063BPV7_USTVR|nr:uncharacterized protein UV8b_07810 [Ustilaginoidea virens]QUC23569.1 hypothetical protein UV8b_07810 [Ustilaginoidea virens]GAO17083.1 hypothetical protein UVI_02003550 [Ustilaginoidea virens]
MARVGDAGLESTSEDDLVEVRVNNSSNRRRNALESLLNPARDSPSFPPTPPARSRSLRPTVRLAPLRMPRSQRQSQPQTPQSTTVIDLTDEPDSPGQARPSHPPRQMARNPRRTDSQRTTPPSLSRSDSTAMGPEAGVIDLTADSPQGERSFEPRAARSHRNHLHHHHHHHHHHHPRRPRPVGRDELIELEFIDAAGGDSFYSNIARGVRRMAGFLGTEFAAREFNVAPIELPPSFPAREPSPKPPMEPVPPVREGFTRNTSSTEEKVVVCPACNEELAYDATGTTAPRGTRKRKRAPGEHHFWALKKCGHVYCADCFENRRPTKASPEGVGFRSPPGKTLIGAPNDIRCAVEHCDTKVALKTEWVGIFL